MDAAEAQLLLRKGDVAGVDPLRGQLAATDFAPEPGFQAFLVWATLLTSLDQFYQEPQSGSIDADPETIEVDGNTGTINSRLTLDATVNGSKLSVDLGIKAKGQVVDKTTGAVIYSIDSEVTGHVDIDFCPDAGGQSAAHVSLKSNEFYTGGNAGAGKGTSGEFSGDVVITVGDDANIKKIDGTSQGQDSSQGGIPAAGSSGGDVGPSSRQSSDNIALDGSGHRRPDVPRNILLGGENSTSDQQVANWGSTVLFTETMVTAAAQEAEKLWKSGKCVELLVDPKGSDVEPDSVTSVTARLHHKIEGNDLDKPVEATLTGVKTLEPDGEKQPAPATVTYTAGPNEGDIGRIAFKSVSNRGIAERAETFTVRRQGWDVGFTGTDIETLAPVVKNTFTIKVTKFKVSSKAGVLSGTGKIHLKGTVTSGPCKGSIDQVGTVSVYSGSVVGEGPAAILRLVVRATSPPGQVVHMHCTPSGGADIGATGHLERFGEPLLEFDLPAAGGTVRVSKSADVGGIFRVTVKGTFTVAIAR